METLKVFFGQVRVGTLTLNQDRSFSFQYDKNWLILPDGFQLSVSLPMQESAITGTHVRAFFANLLPEAMARNRVARCLGISENNDFMLLKQIGGDCAGAISILPEREHPKTPQHYAYTLMTDTQLAEAIRQIPVRPLFAGEEGIRISLAGAQQKLALFNKDGRFYIPLNDAPSNCIVKPAIQGFEDSIENEHFCMCLAHDLKLPVPRTEILTRYKQKGLIIQRYDREMKNGTTVRLHQEDFCQAMGLSHEVKYQADGGPGLKDCFRVVRDYSANPVKDMQLLLQWVFYNFLIGNMDAHGKNLSFLYHMRQIRLAPFYDLICTEVYEGLSKKMAMKIGTEYRPNWTRERHWERLADDINISRNVLRKHLEAFCTRVIHALDPVVRQFSLKYGENDLVLSISKRIRKRASGTLKLIQK